MTLTQPTDTPEPPGQPGGVRRSLADTLARRIADDIIEGRLPPGIRLDEAELAGRFAVSRTPSGKRWARSAPWGWPAADRIAAWW
ncbi:GntR family transcriptional regulator [Tistrella bauzanensis]